jgi:hypothetical protein
LAGSYPAIAVIGIIITAASAATNTPNLAKDLSFIDSPLKQLINKVVS